MIPAHNLTASTDQVRFPEISKEQPFAAEFHDGSVRLYIDPDEFDFHLDRHERALTSVYKAYLDHARRLGFMPEDPDECPPELLEDGYVREWLVPIEPISDVHFEMPSLLGVGHGPFSMELPVVSIVLDDYEPVTRERPALPPLPPMPYSSTPASELIAREGSTATATRRRGRHRK